MGLTVHILILSISFNHQLDKNCQSIEQTNKKSVRLIGTYLIVQKNMRG